MERAEETGQLSRLVWGKVVARTPRDPISLEIRQVEEAADRH